MSSLLRKLPARQGAPSHTGLPAGRSGALVPRAGPVSALPCAACWGPPAPPVLRPLEEAVPTVVPGTWPPPPPRPASRVLGGKLSQAPGTLAPAAQTGLAGARPEGGRWEDHRPLPSPYASVGAGGAVALGHLGVRGLCGPRLRARARGIPEGRGVVGPRGPHGTSLLTHTDTRRHMHRVTHRYRDTDTHTHRCTYSHTHRHSHTQTHTHRHTETQTHTQSHTKTQTYIHRHTCTESHTQTNTQT